MLSAKRAEGNAAGDVERAVKRVKLSADFSQENGKLTTTDVPDDSEGHIGEHTTEDAGPSDLYLDTVCPTYQLLGLDVLTVVF
jgi:hypothetical protein